MTPIADLPLWLALLVSILALSGATLTLIGAIGFASLKSFYERLHAPTLGTSWGMALLVLAAMTLSSYIQMRPVFTELLLGIFVTITTPVTYMLLGRAALYRDRFEGSDAVPSRESIAAGEKHISVMKE